MTRFSWLSSTALRAPDGPGTAVPVVADPAAVGAQTDMPGAGGHVAAPAAQVPAAAAPEAAPVVVPGDAAPAAAPAAGAPEPEKPRTMLEAVPPTPDGSEKAAPAKPEGDAKPATPGAAAAADGGGNKPDAAAEAAAAAAAAPAVEAPAAYEFKFPEGFKADQELLGKFTETARGANLPADVVQAITDHGVAAITAAVAHDRAESQKLWDDTRKSWRDQVLADENIGGSGHETAMRTIARVRDILVPAKDLKSFNDFMAVTGAGDHPVFLKLMHNAARWLDEPAPPPEPPSPPANNGGKPGERKGLKGIYQQNRDTRAANATT